MGSHWLIVSGCHQCERNAIQSSAGCFQLPEVSRSTLKRLPDPGWRLLLSHDGPSSWLLRNASVFAGELGILSDTSMRDLMVVARLNRSSDNLLPHFRFIRKVPIRQSTRLGGQTRVLEY